MNVEIGTEHNSQKRSGSVWHDYRSPTRIALEMCQWETIVLMYKNLPNLTMTRSIRLEAILHITDGWSKLDFVYEILVRPRTSSSATSTSSQSVSCMGILLQ
jgi:hypothetical protein